ncbi:MAG: hypothetical protein QHH30_11020, partial [candidate division NC10 bacterium]|nr:hypothetical protein [candidate division NC10 bacterium]
MKKVLLALLLIALLAWFFGPQAKNAVLSGVIIADIMRYGKPPLLRHLTREPLVKVIRYWGGGREMEADLYVRPDREDSPGIILIHGVNEVGKADPRIRWAAEIL